MIDLTKPLRTIEGKHKAIFLSKWIYREKEYYCFTVNEDALKDQEPWQHRNFSKERIDEIFEETPEPFVVNGFLDVYKNKVVVYSALYDDKKAADEHAERVFNHGGIVRLASIDLSKHEFAIGEGLNPEYEATPTCKCPDCT